MTRESQARSRSATTNERISLDKSMLQAYRQLTSPEGQRAFLAALAPEDCLRFVGMVYKIPACLLCLSALEV